MDVFIQFVIFFGFVPMSSLFPCLLVMSGVYSNKYITFQQIKSFLKDLEVNRNDINYIIYSFPSQLIKNGELIPMKEFKEYLLGHYELFSTITFLRQVIHNSIITRDEVVRIDDRINYYSNPTFCIVRNESFCTRLFKKCFNNKPDPMKYDYYPIKGASLNKYIKCHCLQYYTPRRTSIERVSLQGRKSREFSNELLKQKTSIESASLVQIMVKSKDE